MLRRSDLLHRVAAQHQQLLARDECLRTDGKFLFPLIHPVCGKAFHAAVGEQIKVLTPAQDLVCRRHVAAVLHVQIFIQQHGGAHLPVFQQQSGVCAILRNADKAAAAKVKAPPLAAVRTVHHGAVLIHSQHGVVVQPAQPLGHAVPAAQLHRVALRKAEHKKIRLQLSGAGGDRRHRQTAAVGGKGHPHRGALRAGHIPVQLLRHGGGVHGQPGGAVGGIGSHCQRAGVRHGAQIDAVFQRFAVQVLGAAFHPQLVAGAVVQHKAGLARSQRRAGVTALDAGKAGAAQAVHHAGILVHRYKAAGHGLHCR